MPAFSLGRSVLVAMALTAFGTACSNPGATACSAQTCDGCCGADHVCHRGDAQTACGLAGAACVDCSVSSTVCSAAGVCAGTNDTPLAFDGGVFAQTLFQGAAAFAYAANASATGFEIYKITTGDTLEATGFTQYYPATEGLRVISGGLVASQGGGFGGVALFSDGAFVQLVPDGRGFDNFAGQNDEGDLGFGPFSRVSPASVLRRATLSWETLISDATEEGQVPYMSGNFMCVTLADGVGVLRDTRSAAQYTMNDCMGVIALSATHVAAGEQLIDVPSGTSSPIGQGAAGAGGYRVVILSTSCPGATSDGYSVCSLDANGKMTAISTDAFVPRAAASRLNVSAAYVVVLEPTKSWSINRSTGTRTQILTTDQVTTVSLTGSTLFYAAKDQTGANMVGRLDLATGVDTPIATGFAPLDLQAFKP